MLVVLWLPVVMLLTALAGAYLVTMDDLRSAGVARVVASELAPFLQDYDSALAAESVAMLEGTVADVRLAASRTDAAAGGLEGALQEVGHDLPEPVRARAVEAIEQAARARTTLHDDLSAATPGEVIVAYQQMRLASAHMPASAADTMASRNLAAEVGALVEATRLMIAISVEKQVLEYGTTAGHPVALTLSIGDTDIAEARVASRLDTIAGTSKVPGWDDPARDLRYAVRSGSTVSESDRQSLASAHAHRLDELGHLVDQLTTTAREHARTAADRARTTRDLIAAGTLLTLAMGVAAPCVLRWVLGPWRELRGAATERLALLPDQLSEVVAGNELQPPPSLAASTTDTELTHFAAQIDSLTRTTFALAGEQASARGATARMLQTVARREANLVAQQLTLLDEYERSEESPAILSKLFALDHLATQQRRLSESLLVLGDARPVRRSQEPLALADVVRAAASQIDQYQRLDLQIIDDPIVHGHKVPDLTLLLAELLDNATKYSSPTTRVNATIHIDDEGAVIAITDHGIGMGEADLRDHNTFLATDQQPLSSSDHLGFQIAARLRERTGATVTLQRNTGRPGVTVVIRLRPDALLGHAIVQRRRATSPDLSRMAGVDTAAGRPGISTLYGEVVHGQAPQEPQ